MIILQYTTFRWVSGIAVFVRVTVRLLANCSTVNCDDMQAGFSLAMKDYLPLPALLTFLRSRKEMPPGNN